MKCASAMRVRQRLKQLNIQYFAISQVVLLAILLFNCVNFFSYTTNQINSITEKVEHFETNIKSMRNSIKDLKSTLKETRDEFKSSLRSIKTELSTIETQVIGINEKLAEVVNLTKRFDDVPQSLLRLFIRIIFFFNMIHHFSNTLINWHIILLCLWT